MIASVNKYHGFYVARYEAGKENMNGVNFLVSKKNVMVWRHIEWGDSITDMATTGAVCQARNMYSNLNNYGVTSTLIYGIQWDMVMRWLSDKVKVFDDSRDWGNYCDSKGDAKLNSGSLNITGVNEKWKAKNIYDLAGNCREYTMETYINSSNNMIYKESRGGDFSVSGTAYPASVHYPYVYNWEDFNITFRVALYIN